MRLGLQAARALRREHGIRARVADLRWLNPLPFEAVRGHADACGAVLVVDECRTTGGGVADALVADLAENGFAGRVGSVRAADSFVPLGPSASTVLVGVDDVLRGAVRLVEGRSHAAPSRPAPTTERVEARAGAVPGAP